MNVYAPNPFQSFTTRTGNFVSDANNLISNVPIGLGLADLIEEGCVPLVSNPFSNPRNLLDGGDMTINPFQRNIPGLASGGSLSVNLVYGTGVNQSAANMLAGAWTGQGNITLTPLSSNGTVGAPALQPISSGMTRYSFVGLVPASATQVGFWHSFTPSGTAGAQDGIVVNRYQLEIGYGPGPFEFEEVQIVLEECQRYAYYLAEPASGNVVASGVNTGAGSQIILLQLPTPMFRAPTLVTGLGSFKTNQAGTLTAITTLAASGTHTTNQLGISANSTGTVGQGTLLQGGGGTGYVGASADF